MKNKLSARCVKPMTAKQSPSDRCKRGHHNQEGQEIRKNLWKPGDEGTRYKWNKVGEVQDYEFTCKDCGHVQRFMPL